MIFDTLVDKVKKYRSKKKVLIDKYVDPTLAWASSNAAYIWTADNILDAVSQKVDNNEGLAMFGTYVGLTAGWALANKFAFTPLSKKIQSFQNKRIKNGEEANALSWLRSIGQVGAAIGLYAISNFGATLDNFKYDTSRVIDAFAREQTKIERSIEEGERRDITPTSLEAILPSDLDPNAIRESNIYSTKGRFLRTFRWDEITSEIEEKYDIEEGLIPGLIMRESMGNPLQLNTGNDGGAGLMMFQPGTAKAYGLSIYGNSNKTGRDRNHGRKLRDLVRDHKYNYEVLSEKDERFDVRKSTDAAARYLTHLHRGNRTWDDAISAYNRGTPARNPEKTEHVKMTRFYQVYYLEKKGELGREIDEELLTKLKEKDGHDFKYVRINSKGKSVFEYVVNPGDNPTLIAKDFNRWDKERGDRFRDVSYQDVVNSKGTYIGSKINPNQEVYLLTRRR